MYTVIRENILYVPCWTSSIYRLQESVWEHFDIQITIDYDLKIKIDFISSFWLNCFEYIVQYVYIIYL